MTSKRIAFFSSNISSNELVLMNLENQIIGKIFPNKQMNSQSIKNDYWDWQVYSVSGVFGKGTAPNFDTAKERLISIMKESGFVFTRESSSLLR